MASVPLKALLLFSLAPLVAGSQLAAQPLQGSVDATVLSAGEAKALLPATPAGVGAPPMQAAIAQGAPGVLGVFDAESDADMSVVTARLSTKPLWEAVTLEDHGSFIQFVLKDTIVPHPGQFVEGKGSWIKKLAAYQLSPTDGAVRIFVQGSATEILKAASAEILNDRVVVTLDHKMLAPPVKEGAALEVKEMANAPALTPADMIKGSKAGEPTIGSNALDLTSKLNAVAIFSAVMLIGLVAAHSLRVVRRRKRAAAGPVESFEMKSLTSFSLAPKQRLTLVDVCGERILLSVSPMGVNYITTIGGNNRRGPVQAVVAEPSIRLPAEIQPYFQKSATMSEPQIDLKPAPQVANTRREEPRTNKAVTSPKARSYESNEEEPRRQSERGQSPKAPRNPTSTINYAVTDDGIRNISGQLERESKPGKEHSREISDVTKMIREKLKNLSSIAPQME